MTVKDVLENLDAFAPFSSQESWDNSGLLIGSIGREVTGIVTALDVTLSEAQFAVSVGANLIVAHHPVIFHPIKRIDGDSLYAFLLSHNISVVAAHTNLDKAEGGVNDSLCEKLGLSYKKCGDDVGEGFLNVVRFPEAVPAPEIAALLRERLGGAVSFVDAGNLIRTAAVCSGSGGSFVSDAFTLGVDALVTGEASYHDFLDAESGGLSLFAAGHFETENHIAGILASRYRVAFPNLPVFVSDRENSIITVK